MAPNVRGLQPSVLDDPGPADPGPDATVVVNDALAAQLLQDLTLPPRLVRYGAKPAYPQAWATRRWCLVVWHLWRAHGPQAATPRLPATKAPSVDWQAATRHLVHDQGFLDALWAVHELQLLGPNRGTRRSSLALVQLLAAHHPGADTP